MIETGHIAQGRGSRGQAGVATVVGLFIALTLATVAVGAIGLGRIAVVRSDLQRAADAAVLSATKYIRERGMPFGPAARNLAQEMAQKNVKTGVTFRWTVTERNNRIDIEVRTRATLDLTELVWHGQRTLTRTASARLPQADIGATERRYPKLAMVLDYSGSMSSPIEDGDSERAIDVLEASVEALLEADLTIDYGAVLFETNIIDSAGISGASVSTIEGFLDSYDAGGGTLYADPLRKARDILEAAEDTGYYVLLVSDGQPGDIDEANTVAQELWDAGVTIFTLEIRRSGSTDALSSNLIGLSGTNDSRGNPDYHFVADSADELVKQFENVLAEILCRAGPVVPAPATPAELRVFLAKSGRADVRVPAVGDVYANPGSYGYRYDASTGLVNLTDATCDAVLDNGYRLVARSQEGYLTE